MRSFSPSCFAVELREGAGFEGPLIEGDVLIVDETRHSGGVAEALMAFCAENLDVPFARETAEDSFIATGPAYAVTMPSDVGIASVAKSLVKGGAK